jgi:hypothetical protein
MARPAVVAHGESPTGRARAFAVFIGWQSKRDTSRGETETQAFKIPVGPVMMRMFAV